MKWLSVVCAAVTLACCFAQCVEAKDVTKTRTRSSGFVQPAASQQFQSSANYQMATAPTPQVDLAVNAPPSPVFQREYMPTPTQQANSTFTRSRTTIYNVAASLCQCGCGQANCGCGKAPGYAINMAAIQFGPPNNQLNPNYTVVNRPLLIRTRMYASSNEPYHTTDVSGTTTRHHLITGHGYSREQLRGKSEEELRTLHDQAHASR